MYTFQKLPVVSNAFETLHLKERYKNGKNNLCSKVTDLH